MRWGRIRRIRRNREAERDRGTEGQRDRGTEGEIIGVDGSIGRSRKESSGSSAFSASRSPRAPRPIGKVGRVGDGHLRWHRPTRPDYLLLSAKRDRSRPSATTLNL